MDAKKETDKEQGQHFGFDDTVEVPESPYTLLPKGEAFFTISDLKKERKEFGKFGLCHIAVLKFVVSPVSGDQKGEIDVNLPLVKEMGWKILQVATACGLRKHGDGPEIDPHWWTKFKGADGRCIIGHRIAKAKKEGQKDRTFNEIEEFLAPEEGGLDLK
jgi:hypothetical protein